MTNDISLKNENRCYNLMNATILQFLSTKKEKLMKYVAPDSTFFTRVSARFTNKVIARCSYGQYIMNIKVILK